MTAALWFLAGIACGIVAMIGVLIWIGAQDDAAIERRIDR